MPGGYVNQARMTIQSSGTGTFALAAAVAPFATFSVAGVSSNQIVQYAAIDTGLNVAEQGWGLYLSTGSSTAGPSLTRNPYTNGGTPVVFSSSATQVFVTPSAPDLFQLAVTAHANLGGL